MTDYTRTASIVPLNTGAYQARRYGVTSGSDCRACPDTGTDRYRLLSRFGEFSMQQVLNHV